MKKMLQTLLASFLSLSPLLAQTFSFSFEGQVRTYYVHLPAGYSSTNQYPLVLNFHGNGSNATEQRFYSRMDAVAEKYKFIVVYPQGVNNAWNAGVGLNSDINDAGFVNVLLDTLIKNYSVNTAKVYSCGMSLGGFLTYYLGCNLSDRFTALASVTGVIGSAVAANCNPAKVIPLLHIHGTNDPVVNYNGFTGVLGAEASVGKWVKLNGCQSQPDTTHLPDINTNDQSTVDLIKYTACNNGNEVWFYKVYNGGHTWPGGFLLPNKVTNQDFNASEEIWKFFDRFPLIVSGLETESENLEIKVYPNPVQDKVILTKGISGKIAIQDLAGHIVSEVYLNGSEIDVSYLENGVYIIQIQGDDETNKTSRFIKE